MGEMMSRRSIGVLSALAVCLVSFLAPGVASARPSPDEKSAAVEDVSDAPSQLDGNYEGTLIVEDPYLSPDVVSRLDEFGVNSDNVINIQIPADGEGSLFVMDDNSWVLDTASADVYQLDTVPDGTTTVETTAPAATGRYSYTFCTGTFTTIRKVSNYLQWGGQSNCMASASSVYIHEIYMDLYDTCVGPLCILLDQVKNVRGNEGAYAKIQTAVGANLCESGGGDRTYEQRAKVKVRSVDFGPFWDRDNVVKKCDVEVAP